MDKFKNKYRIPPARLQSWNYASEGMYFITICTKNREHTFGEIENNIMKYSQLGEEVDRVWPNTIILRPDMKIELGEFQVMPNHFHAIVIIGANEYNNVPEISMVNKNTPLIQNKFGSQSKNLAAIVKGFKAAITSFAKLNDIAFSWQTRYHDHIIRNEEEYYRISEYILNNVYNWKDDKFY